jgi:hypothetical protein
MLEALAYDTQAQGLSESQLQQWVCPHFSALDAKTIMAFFGWIPRASLLLWVNSDDLFQKINRKS